METFRLDYSNQAIHNSQNLIICFQQYIVIKQKHHFGNLKYDKLTNIHI